MLVKSINTTQDFKKVGHTLVGAYPIVEEVVPCYPTYGESHSPFYEGYHRDDNLPLLSICHYLFLGAVS